tara:strand:+ start:55 stop:261 length:207 start_codon:yes stop_codon:yes gene_type:complete
MTLLGLKQTMSISENNQRPFNSRDLAISVPPCKYEEVVLYYQETANLYCEPTICGEISHKKIFKEKDI